MSVRKEAEQYTSVYYRGNLLWLQVAVLGCLLEPHFGFLICVTGSTFHDAVFLGFGAWVGPEREADRERLNISSSQNCGRLTVLSTL